MWNVIGTAVQGRGHEAKNVPLQDQIYQQRGDVHVIALADGAGSARLSHIGAERTVQMACKLLTDQFETIFASVDIAEAQQLVLAPIVEQLHLLATEHDTVVKDFASTLLAVAVKDKRALIVHLGDGEIGAIKNGEQLVVSSAENGEYANATFFTTSSQAAAHLKLIKSRDITPFTAFFLMSDGTAHSFYSKQARKFAPVVEELVRQTAVQSEAELNEQLTASFETLVKQKTMDDCSFILMAFNERPRAVKQELRQPAIIRQSQRLLTALEEPKTIPQLVDELYFRRTLVRRNLHLLMRLGYVRYEEAKYSRVKGNGASDGTN